MVSDEVKRRDFLIRIKTLPTDRLLEMLYFENLTEEQKQLIIEELKGRGFDPKKYEKLKKQREEKSIEKVLKEYLPVEEHEEFVNYILSEIDYLFQKYQIYWRLNPTNDPNERIEFYFHGFSNVVDYILALKELKKMLNKKKMMTLGLERDINNLIKEIVRYVRRRKRGGLFDELEDEFFY